MGRIKRDGKILCCQDTHTRRSDQPNPGEGDSRRHKVTSYDNLSVHAFRVLATPHGSAQWRQDDGKYLPSSVLGVHVQAMLPPFAIGDSTSDSVPLLIWEFAFGP